MRATRKDDQGRELRLGESQRKGGLYEYRYKDSVGKRHTIYDRDLDNLRIKEAEIQRVHDAGLDYAEGDITVIELVRRYVSLKRTMRHNTQIGYQFVLSLLEKEAFGTRKIRSIKMSDAKLWLIKLFDDGYSFSTIASIRGIVKPAFQMAYTEEIIRRSEEKGIKVSACHQNRFNVAVQELRRALEGGRFGRLSHGSIHVRWNRNENYYTQAPWRGTWAQDGGCLMNQCIHGIDLLRWMMGDEVEEVYGVTRQQFHDYLQCEDVGMAVVKFKNGAVGTIEGTTNVYPRNLEETLYLFGETGTVKIGGTSTNNIDVWNFADESAADEKNKGLQEATANVYGNGHTSLFADVIEAIEQNRKPYVDAVAGRNALEMILAIYQSAEEKRVIEL